MNENSYDMFYADVRETQPNAGSKEITIDSKVVKALGLKKGDNLKVWIKRVENEMV